MTLRSRHVAIAALAASMLAGTAQAGDLNSINLLNQQQYRLLAEDLGAIASWKALIPAESSGITGFDIGVAALGTQLQNEAEFQLASSNEAPSSTLTQFTLRASKGLPFDFDIGAHYTTVADTNIRVAGGELRWAAVAGGAFIPAVGLRLALSNISGVDQTDVDTISYDVAISKGFAFITPYAGIGQVKVTATPNVGGLAEEDFNLTKIFAGANIALGLMNVLFEADKTGDATTVGLKLGIRF